MVVGHRGTELLDAGPVLLWSVDADQDLNSTRKSLFENRLNGVAKVRTEYRRHDDR